MRFVQQHKLTSTSPATVAVGAISLMQQSTQVPSCNSSVMPFPIVIKWVWF